MKTVSNSIPIKNYSTGIVFSEPTKNTYDSEVISMVNDVTPIPIQNTDARGTLFSFRSDSSYLITLNVNFRNNVSPLKYKIYAKQYVPDPLTGILQNDGTLLKDSYFVADIESYNKDSQEFSFVFNDAGTIVDSDPSVYYFSYFIFYIEFLGSSSVNECSCPPHTSTFTTTPEFIRTVATNSNLINETFNLDPIQLDISVMNNINVLGLSEDLITQYLLSKNLV